MKLWCCGTKSVGYCRFGDFAQLMRGRCQVRTTINIPPIRVQGQHFEAGRYSHHHIPGIKCKPNLAPTVAMCKRNFCVHYHHHHILLSRLNTTCLPNHIQAYSHLKGQMSTIHSPSSDRKTLTKAFTGSTPMQDYPQLLKTSISRRYSSLAVIRLNTDVALLYLKPQKMRSSTIQ